MAETISLDFDRAEFGAGVAGGACASCERSLEGVYYDANGTAVCGSCAAWLSGDTVRDGGGVGRAVRAMAAGAAAGLAGAIVYWGILALSGYEFGLIAIGVGIAVGAAVRWGSRGRGGWRYQLLAAALTYLSIVCAYVPVIVQSIHEGAQARAEGPATVAADADAAAPVTAATDDAPPTLGDFVIAVAVIVALAAAVPVLGGVENIMGLIIIGFGLWQAWKMNRRPTAVVTGPHAFAPAVPPAP